MISRRFIQQRKGLLRALPLRQNRCISVLAIFGVLVVVSQFVGQWALQYPLLEDNSSSINAAETVYPTCRNDSLELCQLEDSSGKSANSPVLDAHLRTCRSEGQLFAATVNTTQVDKCLSFEDLVSLPNTQWARVRLPEAFMAYPMDVDLQSLVLAYSYGLTLNIKPINNPSLSVVRRSKTVCAAGINYWTIIIVKSAIPNYARRLLLRKVIRRQDAKVRVLFSLGLPANGQIPPDLLKEISQFDDILIATYTDTYQNLTLKTIVNLRFVHYNCLNSSPSFVFLDDDHGINLTQLHRVLSKYSVSELRGGIFGAIYPRSRVMRSSEHRWFTPVADYPFPRFPAYANGPCYVIGADLIRKLSIASAFTRPLPNEDVYVGMMLFKLGVGIHPLPNMLLHKRLEATNASPLVAILTHFVRVLNIK